MIVDIRCVPFIILAWHCVACSVFMKRTGTNCDGLISEGSFITMPVPPHMAASHPTVRFQDTIILNIWKVSDLNTVLCIPCLTADILPASVFTAGVPAHVKTFLYNVFPWARPMLSFTLHDILTNGLLIDVQSYGQAKLCCTTEGTYIMEHGISEDLATLMRTAFVCSEGKPMQQDLVGVHRSLGNVVHSMQMAKDSIQMLVTRTGRVSYFLDVLISHAYVAGTGQGSSLDFYEWQCGHHSPSHRHDSWLTSFCIQG